MQEPRLKAGHMHNDNHIYIYGRHGNYFDVGSWHYQYEFESNRSKFLVPVVTKGTYRTVKYPQNLACESKRWGYF